MSEAQSIYIHIPFCVKKCFYCDFYSTSDLVKVKDYVESLIKEINLRSDPNIKPNTKIDTIYFGGGTPSVLKIADIEKILFHINQSFIINPQVEITFELNPGTVNKEYLQGLKKTGINRISVGVQSFNNQRLQFLQRVHDANEAKIVLNDIKNIGFKNVSLDLIYGLPKDSLKETDNHKAWLDDLDIAIDFFPGHISCYMLTFEPGTPMYKAYKNNLIRPLDKNALSDLFMLTSKYLENKGYIHYEISSFAVNKEYRSKHNSRYWQLLPYIGLGASAHSFQGGRRSWNHADIDLYISDLKLGNHPVADSEDLTVKQQMLEIIMLGLRTSDGIDIRKFNSLSKINFETHFKDILTKIQTESLGRIKDKRLLLTLEGRTYLNSITQMFADKII